jgi:hypothetical protein
MSNITTGSPQTDKSLLSLLLGFFGVTAAFLLLPKTVKFVIRRFITGILSEIVAVVVTGLLTEKLVGFIAEQHDSERLPEPPPHR